MTITKRPTARKPAASTAADPALEKALDDFIGSAPDAASSKPAKPPKTLVSFQIPLDLLAKVDEAASALSLTRAGYIKGTSQKTENKAR